MKLRYVGPHDRVEVPALGAAVVDRDGVLELPAELRPDWALAAGQLLQQDTWEPADKAAETLKTRAAAPEVPAAVSPEPETQRAEGSAEEGEH